MSTPSRRATEANMSAPGPVRRSKGNPLRQYWLTGAFAIGLVGVISLTGMQVYRVDQSLEQVRQKRAQVDWELKEAREKNRRLQESLEKVTSDEYMELMAKKMGFTKPDEKVYQTGASSGR